MKSMKTMVIALCAGIVMTGCNNLAKGTAIGAAGGAALGAIVGKIAGNTAVGAAIGGAVGATAGTLIGKHMDKVRPAGCEGNLRFRNPLRYWQLYTSGCCKEFADAVCQ